MVAAGLAVAASFMLLYWQSFGADIGGLEGGQGPTAWEWVMDNSPFDPQVHPTRYGIPIVVAAALLVGSAVLAFRSPRLSVLAAFVAPLGAALLTGAVWSAGEDVLSVQSYITAGGPAPPNAVFEVGQGLWVLIVASVTALAGAALMMQPLPPREKPQVTGPVVIHRIEDDEIPPDDTDTPPYGMPRQEDT
ncbi:hypothetical protein Lesp02_67450 [Lentzea sp. NBRC 105346]|nr:hypothetical protein Lesp02_67450 [Lentzea sp. NBRC 105346]